MSQSNPKRLTGAAFVVLPEAVVDPSDSARVVMLFTDPVWAMQFCNAHGLPTFNFSVSNTDAAEELTQYLRRLHSAGARYVAVDDLSNREPFDEIIRRNDR